MPIVFFMKGDQEETCSGFAIAPDIVLTNHHCIASAEQALAATLKFGYLADGEVRQVINGASLLLLSPEHDASFLHLSEPINAPFTMPPWRAGPPITGEPLALAQHPGNDILKVSDDKDCLVGEVKLDGRRRATVDFGHRCDTEGGSSGAMVVGRRKHCRQVIGLHHWGVANWAPGATNQAVRIDRLTAFLRDAAAQQKDVHLSEAAKGILSHLTLARCS